MILLVGFLPAEDKNAVYFLIFIFWMIFASGVFKRKSRVRNKIILINCIQTQRFKAKRQNNRVEMKLKT